MSHTKGPWKFDIGNMEVEQVDSRQGVCNIATEKGFGENEQIPYHESVANGDLISAAPDMLQTLEIVDMILSSSHVVKLEDGKTGILYYFEQKDLEDIKKAIKKAKGEI